MASDNTLPKALLAKRDKELTKMQKTGTIALADVFRMVYENISENEEAKKHAPEELKKLRVSLDVVLSDIDTISKKVKAKSRKGPKGPGGKRPPSTKRKQTARKTKPTTRKRTRK